MRPPLQDLPHSGYVSGGATENRRGVSKFVETWLNNNISDSAIQLEQLTCFQQTELSPKGLKLVEGDCVFTSTMPGVVTLLFLADTVHNRWSSRSSSADRSSYWGNFQPYCFLLSLCLPAPIATSEALNELYQHISEQHTAHPDAFLILVGHFNHADPNTVLPKLYKHITFPTRGNNFLDNVFTSQREDYKAPHPPP